MKQYILLCNLIFCFLSFTWETANANIYTIQEISGIDIDEGETITFRYLNQTFSVYIPDNTVPNLGVNFLDYSKLQKLAHTLNQQIAIKEQDAYIDEQGHIVEHLTGVALDLDRFFLKILQFCYEDVSNTEILPVRLVPPRVTTQTLKLSMEKRISGFVTYYNVMNQNRTHNINLAAKSIHNFVVLPGEVFSFNKVVGKRTMEKGYKRAPIIVKGELSEGIGGGICQVSSTLYNAVDKAGLTVLKRYSHSKQVGYVPPGRDATVSWYGPDFIFRNDYDHPIMVKCYVKNGIHSIEIYSSKELEAELRKIPNASKKLPEETHGEIH